MDRGKIKTLLIEDSGLSRILLSDVLRRDDHIMLIGTAINGRQGVEKALALKPDVVITDMVMPEYDGLYVVQELMRAMPLPIIVLSSLDRNSPIIFDALNEGAFDFVDKPDVSNLSHSASRLNSLVREASMTDYVKLRHLRPGRNIAKHTFEPALNYEIIVVGASTGGPGAVEFIINNLPANLPVPVLVVQHMPERFISSFASRMGESSVFPVEVMDEGKPLLAGHIYLAPGSSNIAIRKTKSYPVVRFVSTRYREFNDPSIDCVFESVAEVFGARAIGVVLTGMGRDGTNGLLRLRQAGALTVAQDEASSVVYGMPKSAMESGAARHTIPLNEIPGFLVSAL